MEIRQRMGWEKKGGRISNCFVTTDKLKSALWSFAQFNVPFPADVRNLYRLSHYFFFFCTFFHPVLFVSVSHMEESGKIPLWLFHCSRWANKRKGSIEVGFKRIWRIVSLIIHAAWAALCWAHLSEWRETCSAVNAFWSGYNLLKTQVFKI